MKTVAVLLGLMAAVPAEPALAAELNQKSLAPAWVSASQAERDAWLGAYTFENPGIDRGAVAKCLDDMAPRPPLATNALTGVTSLCETIVKLDG